MTWRCGRYLWVLLLLAALPGIVLVASSALVDFAEDVERHRFAILGMAAYAALATLRPGAARDMELFTHELVHAVAAKLSLKTISEFLVRRHGDSHVVVERPNRFVLLAPYCLPLFLLPCLLLEPLLRPRETAWIDATIGFTSCLHLFLVVRHFSFRQSDIVQSGRVLAAATVVVTMALTCTLVVVVVIDGWQKVPQVAERILAASQGFWMPWTKRSREIIDELF